MIRNNKILWWIIGILVAIIFSGGSYWLSNLDARSREHDLKIVRLEVILPEVREQLKAIDLKLDTVLVEQARVLRKER